MTKKKFSEVSLLVLFGAAIVVIFGNYCRLRPAAYPSFYKEYISGLIVLAAFYTNLLFCFPLLFARNRHLAYVFSVLILNTLATTGEFLLVYPQIHNLLLMQFGAEEVIHFHVTDFAFIFARDFGFATFAFMLAYIKHLSHLNLSKDMMLLKRHKEIGICLNSGSMKTIDYEKICLCKQNGNYTRIYLNDGTYYDNISSLSHLYEIMDEQYVLRFSRSYLVMLKAIVEYDNAKIKVNIGKDRSPVELYFPRRRAKMLYSQIQSYLEGQNCWGKNKFGVEDQLDEISKLHGHEKIIYQYIRKHPSCSSADLQKHTKLSPNSVYRYTSSLKQKGFIKHVGSNKTGGYRAVESLD